MQKLKVTEEVTRLLDLLNDEERAKIFGQYCTHCGRKDSSCSCWNDE